MLASIFNAHGASGLPVSAAFLRAESSNYKRHRLYFHLRLEFHFAPVSPLFSDMPTVDDLIALPFFAETEEQRIEQGSR